MNQQSIVSVIIPVFNGAPYVQVAVESVLNQTFKNFEIIVVDDGSTDNTRDVLESYIQLNKIKYIHQNNKGISHSRNLGIKFATGEFLKFLDSDDFLYTNQLELQVKDLIEQGSDISISNYNHLYDHGKVGIRKNIIIKKSYQLVDFIRANRAPVHSFMVRKNIIVKVDGFDETLTAFEDYDLWLRLIINGAKVSLVDYIGCCYRIHNKSISSDDKLLTLQKFKMWEKINQILLDNFNSLNKNVLDALLWNNFKLIHLSLLIKCSNEISLFYIHKMAKKIFLMRKKGLKLFIFKLLGIKKFSYLHYKVNILKKGYKEMLLNEEKRWRSDESVY